MYVFFFFKNRKRGGMGQKDYLGLYRFESSPVSNLSGVNQKSGERLSGDRMNRVVKVCVGSM